VSDRRCPRVGEARVRRHFAVPVPNRLERLVGAFDAAVASGAGDDVKIRSTTARRMRLRESWERVRLFLRTSVRCSRRVRPRYRISSRLMFEDAFSSAIITVARAIAPLVAVFGNPPDDALESRCSSGATNCSGSCRSRILLQLLRANRVPPVLGRPIGLPLGPAGAQARAALTIVSNQRWRPRRSPAAAAWWTTARSTLIGTAPVRPRDIRTRSRW
jgi:hypothetical protein